MFVMVWQLPDVSAPLLWTSLAFPLYYIVLSLAIGGVSRRATGSQ
jgi:hypothetical protein